MSGLPAELLAKYPSLGKFDDNDDEIESHDGREVVLLKYIYSHPSLDQLRGSPQAICDVMDEFAAKEDFLINIGSDKGKKVHDMIKEEKPSVLVELGGYVGYSAISFGDAMRQAAGPGESVRLWSLEFDPLIASIAMNLIDLAGLSDVVRVVVGTAEDSLKRLHAEGKLTNIDFLFLDHVEDLYLSDFKVCEELKLLRSGALVVADNVVRPGAPEYREHIRKHPGVESWGVKGLIMPGEFEDELEVTRIK
ncbi:S-adenosyl-L-methionine-dependent methyltransferase [Penicillium malachiteum]|uniref:catechol O-methyltransferase n=1 Tax=Penicillium malachiteum TaxID=1324776 RepID=A0AAD6MWA3_9EURO|nr:S-adenosyl-L-methionine-dependent methyltransferase [Penicillium malachiteum]